MPHKILVIEDNPDYREIFGILIQHLGYEIVQAASAAAGIEKASSEHPDLILLDLVMPHMSGIELTAQLKSSPATRHIPVVICTAWMGTDRKNEAIRQGAAEVLTKPISKSSLAGILRRHLLPETTTNPWQQPPKEL